MPVPAGVRGLSEVLIAAALRFVHEAMMPLLLPLLLVAAVAAIWWLLQRPRNPGP